MRASGSRRQIDPDQASSSPSGSYPFFAPTCSTLRRQLLPRK
jgi:hypothetical protein